MIFFRLGSMGVKIRFSFLLLLSLLLLLQELELGGTFLLAVLWHELGHLLLMILLKLPPTELELSAFGVALRRERSGGFWGELVLYLAGPAANLLACTFLLPWDKVSGLFHLILAALNLLPIAPMDGGNITELLLEQFLDPSAARKTSHRLSLIVWIVLLLGAAAFLLKQWNPSLLIFVLLLGLQNQKS